MRNRMKEEGRGKGRKEREKRGREERRKERRKGDVITGRRKARVS